MQVSDTPPAAPGRHEHYEVRVLRADEHAAAAAAAARALQDDPASIACYGDEALVRLARTHGLFVELFARVTAPQYGAVAGTCVLGVAGVVPPGACVGAVMAPFAAEALARPEPPLGDPTRPAVLWATWAVHDLAEEHWHIGPVGIDPGFQGRGIGRAVMEGLCAELDAESRIGWLETNRERNVRFYSALGFEVVERVEALGVPNWFMRRDPR